jgi:hypothetical protein
MPNMQVSPKKDESVAPLFIGGFLIIYTTNEMVVNRLQNGLLNSRRAPRVSRLICKNIFSNANTLLSSNSDRDFYSENNNV